MSLWDKLRGELIDIIEWTEPPGSEILAYRFPRYNNEIKMGAKLTVREGQAAVLRQRGPARRRLSRPACTRSRRENMPILSTLKGWKYGFNSPFKAEVYFISTKQWTDLKWGTQNPIMLRDPEFGPVRIRAFGTYAMQVSDPGTFLKQLVATDPSLRDVRDRQPVAEHDRLAVRGRRRPGEDAGAGPGRQLREARQAGPGPASRPELAAMGLTLTQFYIENISLPPEVEQALDTRTKMGVLGNLDQYTKYQTAEAIRDAAKNPGGIAGAGVGHRGRRGDRPADGRGGRSAACGAGAGRAAADARRRRSSATSSASAASRPGRST